MIAALSESEIVRAEVKAAADRITRKERHCIETCVDLLARRKWRENPQAQKPGAHRGKSPVENRKQRSPGITAPK